MKSTAVKKNSGVDPHSRWHAVLVGSGILLSRLAGLVRDRVFAHYFGNSDAADAFKAAFRIPNFLQNLFGEGVLSASFIPVYANLLGRGEEEEARKVAGAVAGLLMLVTSILVAAGVVAAPYLIDGIAPGFTGEKRELCITLVRILFPGAGLMVWSAWCLGVLNSHGKFFLSYAAPVVWNLVIIAALLFFGEGGAEQFPLAEWAAWGSVAGSAAQILIQLPTVLRLLAGLRLSLSARIGGVATVIRNFVPVFFSRGVVQISAYVDSILASLLPTGAVAALAYAQTLYTLPVSLFGMSVSAAELPAMARDTGGSDAAEKLRGRLNDGLRRIAFFIVPSAAGFLTLGDVIAAAIYQTGAFTRWDSIYVWGVLAGSSVGLLANTMGRLYSSAFYALHDTRTPLRFALVRVSLATALGYLASQHLPAMIGIDTRWGVTGITAASGFCGWVEFALLRRALNGRIGATGPGLSYIARLWIAAILAVAAAWGMRFTAIGLHPVLRAVVVLGPYGLVYFAAAWALGIKEVRALGRFIPFIKK
ncbi:MAG: murein biosynthesis integral membrane protein MurJ [Spirochaetes bacterium]|nr:murein biosynthesis integral membrane protein MurJ [Spirochaetota bacterium]